LDFSKSGINGKVLKRDIVNFFETAIVLSYVHSSCHWQGSYSEKTFEELNYIYKKQATVHTLALPVLALGGPEGRGFPNSHFSALGHIYLDVIYIGRDPFTDAQLDNFAANQNKNNQFKVFFFEISRSLMPDKGPQKVLTCITLSITRRS
jgi:hypothetical protein